MADGRAPRIGVLALQGDFAAHRAILDAAGAASREVRRPAEMADLDGLVMPGGESTALSVLLDFEDMRGAIAAFAARGGAVFGTCAGLILLAREIAGEDALRTFGLLDVTVARNDYGRQRESFEGTAAVPVLDEPRYPLVFIRAPRILRTGPGVEVLAAHGGSPILVRQGHVLGASFHPEIAGDPRLHRWFVREIAALSPGRPAATAAPVNGRSGAPRRSPAPSR